MKRGLGDFPLRHRALRSIRGLCAESMGGVVNEKRPRAAEAVQGRSRTPRYQSPLQTSLQQRVSPVVKRLYSVKSGNVSALS